MIEKYLREFHQVLCFWFERKLDYQENICPLSKYYQINEDGIVKLGFDESFAGKLFYLDKKKMTGEDDALEWYIIKENKNIKDENLDKNDIGLIRENAIEERFRSYVSNRPNNIMTKDPDIIRRDDNKRWSVYKLGKDIEPLNFITISSLKEDQKENIVKEIIDCVEFFHEKTNPPIVLRGLCDLSFIMCNKSPLLVNLEDAKQDADIEPLSDMTRREMLFEDPRKARFIDKETLKQGILTTKVDIFSLGKLIEEVFNGDEKTYKTERINYLVNRMTNTTYAERPDINEVKEAFEIAVKAPEITKEEDKNKWIIESTRKCINSEEKKDEGSYGKAFSLGQLIEEMFNEGKKTYKTKRIEYLVKRVTSAEDRVDIDVAEEAFEVAINAPEFNTDEWILDSTWKRIKAEEKKGEGSYIKAFSFAKLIDEMLNGGKETYKTERIKYLMKRMEEHPDKEDAKEAFELAIKAPEFKTDEEEHKWIIENIWKSKNIKVDEKIGEGSYGKVYKCIENSQEKSIPDEYCAIKILSIPQKGIPLRSESADLEASYYDQKEERLREIKMAKKCQGNNVVTLQDYHIIHHLDSAGWYILIKMDYYEKDLESFLQEHIDDSKTEAEKYAIDICLDICKALKKAHKNKVIHRDIKPANIFLDKNSEFFLCDFGLDRDSSQNGIFSYAGSDLYKAPEVGSSRRYDGRCDIYSLGITLYKALNKNRHPFSKEYPKRITDNDKQNMPDNDCYDTNALPFPSNCSQELGRIVLKMCSYEPDHRYTTVEEVRKAIEAYKVTHGDRIGSQIKEKTDSIFNYDDLLFLDNTNAPKDKHFEIRTSENDEISIPKEDYKIEREEEKSSLLAEDEEIIETIDEDNSGEKSNKEKTDANREQEIVNKAIGTTQEAYQYLKLAEEQKDEEAARRAFQIYSSLDSTLSMGGKYNLGYCYSNGIGTSRDYEKALLYYKSAAEMGDPKGQLMCGRYYKNGTGMNEPNVNMAFFFYLEAATSTTNKIRTQARTELGELYEKEIIKRYKDEYNDLVAEGTFAKKGKIIKNDEFKMGKFFRDNDPPVYNKAIEHFEMAGGIIAAR